MYSHKCVLLRGDIDASLEARLDHCRLYSLSTITETTVLLVLQSLVQRVQQPAEEVRRIASGLHRESLLAGARHLVHELEVTVSAKTNFMWCDVAVEARVRPQLAKKKTERVHQGTLGVRVVGGDEEEIANRKDVGQRLNHHVHVVRLADHVHPHHSQEVFVAGWNVVVRCVLIQSDNIAYAITRSGWMHSLKTRDRALL